MTEFRLTTEALALARRMGVKEQSMARVPGEEVDTIYRLHRHWLAEVVQSHGSLITPGTAIWTPEALGELEARFIGQPDTTSGKSFLDKLHEQLNGATPTAIQLMAEVNLVHFLMIWKGAISAARKLTDVQKILSWLPHPPVVPSEVAAAMAPGVAHPGQFAIRRRDAQLTWLILFARTWLADDPAARDARLGDPWAFREFVLSVQSPAADAAQLSMLHLAHPDTFEPIVNGEHKKVIVERFNEQANGLTDFDQAILAIRSSLASEYGEAFQWYDDPLVYRWLRGPAWEKFISWAKRAREVPAFDELERNDKVELADRLRVVKALVLNDDPAWPEELKKVIRHSKNNLTQWRRNDLLLDWCLKEPASARSALTGLWAAGPWQKRMQNFASAISHIAGLGGDAAQLNLISFLLMADDSETFPPVQIAALRRGLGLAGWGSDLKALNGAAAYRRGLALFDELIRSSTGWPHPLRDRIDAQGVVWMLAKYEDSKWFGWPDGVWNEFNAWRDPTPFVGDPDDPPATVAAPGSEPIDPLVDHIELAAKDLHVDRAHLDEIVGLLADKGQVVLYGPPGTGKTYLAKRLARALVEADEDRVAIVQFHPATSYEDFFEGLRPQVTDAGQVTYTLTAGPLVRIADKARQDPDKRTHVLLIDEINRANLPKVFGELLFLLEYREEEVHTVYRPETKFGIPENLLVIGTMNTADRSIALIDAAMRRRFHFVPFFPHEGAMKDLLRNVIGPTGRTEVADLLDKANADLEALLGRHLLIGPSHFIQSDLSNAALERIWSYNVYPLIEEQLWGNRDEVERWTWAAVSARYLYPEAEQDASSTAEPVHQPSGSTDE